MYYVYSDELHHHGTLGMRWGIRRFQPYPKGERVKGGKEIGEAAKVKQYTDYKISKKKASIDKKISKLKDKSSQLETKGFKLEAKRAKASKKSTKQIDKITKKIYKQNKENLQLDGVMVVNDKQAKKLKKATSLKAKVGKLDMQIYKNDKKIAAIPKKISKLNIKTDKYAKDLIETGKRYLEDLKKKR